MRKKDEDLAQDIAVASLRIRRRGIRSPTYDTLLTRAKNRLDQRNKRTKRRNRMFVPLDSLLEEPAAPDNRHVLDATEQFLVLLRGASTQQHAVMVAAVRLGLTRKEVANLLGITPAQVSHERARALDKMRSTASKRSGVSPRK